LIFEKNDKDTVAFTWWSGIVEVEAGAAEGPVEL
jgi:hypothetical protein